MSKLLSVKLPDDLWEALKKEATERNTTVSDITKRILIKDLLNGKLTIRRQNEIRNDSQRQKTQKDI